MSASSIGRTAAELRRIAEELLALASERELDVESHPGWDATDPGSHEVSRLAHLMYQARADRSYYFDEVILGEPGWDMLLDLFVARSSGKGVSATSLCHAARVAQTTGLRWIANLEDAGLIVRYADGKDGRVSNVALTDVAARLMHAYLERLMSAFNAMPEFTLALRRRQIASNLD